MITKKYLFELNVYRLTKEKYYDGLRTFIAKQPTEFLPTSFYHEQYGGDWQYNEIIGYLKFYQYDKSQIRNEYWETNSTRKVKTRRKQFIQISDKYCERIFTKDKPNEDIFAVITDCLDHCQNRLNKKNRYVDTEIFNNIAKHIDWKSVLI